VQRDADREGPAGRKDLPTDAVVAVDGEGRDGVAAGVDRDEEPAVVAERPSEARWSTTEPVRTPPRPPVAY
jgi:hypothetical protein